MSSVEVTGPSFAIAAGDREITPNNAALATNVLRTRFSLPQACVRVHSLISLRFIDIWFSNSPESCPARYSHVGASQIQR